uniref:Ribonucleoside-diphosphate reductase large subunit n=1 Tax=Anatid alphaherpesvirus 2 TaxID=3080522 RepID=A0AAU0K6Z1_9ALPH
MALLASPEITDYAARFSYGREPCEIAGSGPFASGGLKRNTAPSPVPGVDDAGVARAITAELSAIERELTAKGHLKLPEYASPSGVCHETGAYPTLAEIRARVTLLVNQLKAKCRVDERLYLACGELVHLRIATSETSFDAWLASRELGLNSEVSAAIRANRELVENNILQFYKTQFHEVKMLGLQSALKYEEVYLARLEDGRKESLGQFFARLAAVAATESIKTPQFASALTTGSPNWGAAFGTFFWELAHQTFVPATPCMLFLGREGKSTASCYLLNPCSTTTDDAIQAMMDEVVPLMRARGGIGISLQRLNTSVGLMPVLKLLDSLVAASNAGNIRPSGACVYVEPWHADVMSVLNMRGLLAAEESRRCDNLFAALWTCDLLFKRYESYLMGNQEVYWTLFDSRANILSSLYGEDFEREYERLEALGVGVSRIHIRDMMYAVVKSAASTGSPFVVFKDAFNRHYHLDMQGRAIMTSNLCTEIVHDADPDSDGVCSLVSVNLAKCVRKVGGKASFDFTALRRAVRVATVFVNTMVQCGTRPTDRSERGVRKHRSIGIGVQGLHTAILALGLDMVDDDSRALNRRMFELMLLEAMTVSCEFCETGLEPFHDFRESAYAVGRFHFDGWPDVTLTEAVEWDALRARVMTSGVYNSQFIALMPTAASAQVTEVSEGFAPLFSNMFSKVTLAGELLRPNLQLMEELRTIYANDEAARLEALDLLEASGWSVVTALGNRPECAPLMKYKTAFEYDQTKLIDLCRERAPFVDHSQSMTLFVTEMADGTLPASGVMKLLLHAYKRGLKTGMYYCKIRKATNNGVFSGSGELVCTACHL